MKHLLTILIVVLSSKAMAQGKAFASISATIVKPVSISKTDNVDYSNMAISGTALPVMLKKSGSRYHSNVATFIATTAKLNVASIIISGQGAYVFAVTLQLAALTICSGTNSMKVGNFISRASSIGALPAGGETINVDATLTFAANQPPGTYISPVPFTITVNYN